MCETCKLLGRLAAVAGPNRGCIPCALSPSGELEEKRKREKGRERERGWLTVIVIIVIIRCIINAAARATASRPRFGSPTKSLSMLPAGHLHN